MKGGTGVLIDPSNAETNFMEFIKHSKVSYLSNGTFGIAFIVGLTDESYQSPYKHLDAEHFMEPVRSLLIKISIVSNDNNDDGDDSHDSNGSNDSDSDESISDVHLRPISKQDFEREVNIQTDVFLKTMNYTKPLCPAIVFSEYYDSTQTNGELLTLIRSQTKTSRSMRYIDNITSKNTGYTIIAMEMMYDYDTIYEEMKHTTLENEDEMLMTMYAFMLIQLVIKTGYSHADFHTNNAMVYWKDTSYFEDIRGSMLLIDFGMAVKLKPYQMNEFKQYYEQKKYNAFIKKLCNIPRSDGLVPNHYPKSYEICNTKINEELLEKMIVKHEARMNRLVQEFNQTHPDMRLPLSNSIKRQMFPGLFITQPPVHEVHRIMLTNISTDQKHLDVYNIVCEWIRDVIQREDKKRIQQRKRIGDYPQMLHDKTTLQIYSCYNTVYLLSLEEFKLRSKFQLASIVGMYCSGLKIPFEEFETLCGACYSAETIKNECEQYEKMFSNIHIITILDFQYIMLGEPSILDMIKQSPEVLTNPHEYLKKHLVLENASFPSYTWVNDPISKPSELAEEYEFPFANEGGSRRRISKKQKRRTSKTNKRRCYKH